MCMLHIVFFYFILQLQVAFYGFPNFVQWEIYSVRFAIMLLFSLFFFLSFLFGGLRLKAPHYSVQ